MRGDIDEGKVALAESVRLNPQVDSLEGFRRFEPWATHPRYLAPRAATLDACLRKLGFPDK